VGPGGRAGHVPAFASQVVAGQAPWREGGCGVEGEEFVAVSDYFSEMILMVMMKIREGEDEIEEDGRRRRW